MAGAGKGQAEATVSEAVTRAIRVRVESAFVPARSAPQRRVFFFSYRVTLANEGQETVQLISRYWRIVDAAGKTEDVRGPGVVGEQPRLMPGQRFVYSSFCALETAVGSMHGSYNMVSAHGEQFDVRIAPFTLAMPHAIN